MIELFQKYTRFIGSILQAPKERNLLEKWCSPSIKTIRHSLNDTKCM